jgi:cytochrome c biogenesis protein CcdA
VLRLAFVCLSVGLADSLTPEIVGPALYLAALPGRVWSVLQYTAGVFVVHFGTGLVLTTLPGGWLAGLVPRPEGTAKHVLELIAGAVLLACAAGLWLGRRSLSRRELPAPKAGGGSALIAGVSIAAVGMPTAIPYLATVAAIVASNSSIPQEVGLLAIYNVAFIAPLLTILAILLVAGDRADRHLDEVRAWLQRQWPVVLAVLLLLVGSILVILGGAGLVED